MHEYGLHLPRILILALLAMLLGIALLELDGRDPAVATAAAAAPSQTAAAQPAPGQLVAAVEPAAADAATPPSTTTEPAPTEPVVQERRGGVTCADPHRTVQVMQDTPIRTVPNGRVIGTLPANSRYLGQGTTAWLQAVNADGTWGRVSVPWSTPVTRTGWIPLAGMPGRTTRTLVVADLSERMVRVYRGCDELFAIQSAIGRTGSPSPQGRFWVSDRVAVPRAQQGSYGTFAFGLSTVQPNLPDGWTGGDQMAIHGTGAPGSIGQAASAGCLRVSENSLARLRPLLRVGTPVVIQA